MKQHKPTQRILAMAMSIVMVLGMTPITAFAETPPIGTSGEIIAFEALSEETTNREVPLGTSLKDLDLPDTLNATVRFATDTDADEPVQDSGQVAQEQDPDEQEETDAPDGDPAEGEPVSGTGPDEDDDQPDYMDMDIPVPVEWVSTPDYDGETAGIYTFTAEIEGFTVSADLPTITVTVGTPAGVVTAFDALESDIRWQSVEFGTPQSALNLPTALFGTIEGEAAEVPVKWESEPIYDANTKGLYLFTAKLGEGFRAAAELPHITVVVRAGQPQNRMFARSFGGGAQSADPFLIGTAAQLAEIATLTNAGQLETMFLGTDEGTVYLKLDNDIDLSGYRSDDGWVPIGRVTSETDTAPFSGSFDGANHKITGLYINRPGAYAQGLFGYVGSGTVKNLGIVGADITGGIYTGGVAGGVLNGTVENCYSTGTVSGTDRVGGVAGYVHLNGTVQNCTSSGAVSGTDRVGGVAGRVSGTVQNCAALNPSVSGASDVGRVAGYGSSGLSGNIAFSGMTVTENGNAKTLAEGAENVDGASKTAAVLKANTENVLSSLFTEANGWTYVAGKLPILTGLAGQDATMPAHIVDGSDPNFRGAGTAGNPYQISTAAQLAKLAELVNTGNADYNSQYYKLAADIDLSAYGRDYDEGKGWVPIGNWNKSFSGNFNGNGKTITGLYINDSTLKHAGLFGCIRYGTVENVGMINATITGKEFVGSVAGSVVIRATVKNCYAIGTIAGISGVGGVAGHVSDENTTVENCYSVAVVTGTSTSDWVGGIAGYAANGASLKNCVALGPSASGGRVIGYQGTGSFENNYAFSGMTVNGSTVSDGLSGNA